MPRHDGTGPGGFGPMTGKGLGFCILKISGSPGEPYAGFAGESGRPVILSPGEGGTYAEIEGRLVHWHPRKREGFHGSQDNRTQEG